MNITPVFIAGLAICVGSNVACAEDFTLQPGASFDWVLSERLKGVPSVDVVDLDLFDADAAIISKLNAAGKKTVCYINVGAWENWRPDKDRFAATSIGKDYDGWPGEKWLDIANQKAIAEIITARLDLCKQKGFWGVEPDNINLHEQDTGFKIARQQQIDYNIWLAAEAHKRGLSIGLKNVPDLLPDLLQHYDWALLEDCFAQRWCNQFKPMLGASKAVIAVEYTDSKINFKAFCNDAKIIGYFPILKKRELGTWSKRCP